MLLLYLLSIIILHVSSTCLCEGICSTAKGGLCKYICGDLTNSVRQLQLQVDVADSALQSSEAQLNELIQSSKNVHILLSNSSNKYSTRLQDLTTEITKCQEELLLMDNLNELQLRNHFKEYDDLIDRYEIQTKYILTLIVLFVVSFSLNFKEYDYLIDRYEIQAKHILTLIVLFLAMVFFISDFSFSFNRLFP